MFFRNAYDYVEAKAVSNATATVVEGETMTQQSQAEEADINTIVRRFGVTGMIPQSIRPPTYADFDEVFDFQTAQNAIIEAERSFMAMPADVRARFANDPQAFVEFCSDAENLPEMRKLGLAIPEVIPDTKDVAS